VNHISMILSLFSVVTSKDKKLSHSCFEIFYFYYRIGSYSLCRENGSLQAPLPWTISKTPTWQSLNWWLQTLIHCWCQNIVENSHHASLNTPSTSDLHSGKKLSICRTTCICKN
jgi:hypothetical protein